MSQSNRDEEEQCDFSGFGNLFDSLAQVTLLLKLKEVAPNTSEDFFCDYVRGRCVD